MASANTLTAEAFQELAAAGHTRIPMVREVLSDLDTPLSVYLKLADGPHTYLFESVEGGETWGRYSIIGLPARLTYTFRGPVLETRAHGELVETRTLEDPLAEVDKLRETHKVPRVPGLPAFTGGLVGYFGFESIGYIEPRLAGALPDGSEKPDQLGTPDAFLMLSEELAVFDNLKGRLYLIVHADPSEPQAHARALRRLDELVFRLRHSGRSYPDVLDPSLLQEADFVSGFTKEGFVAAVDRVKEYIRAGDVFQVVLSQRMSVPFRARPVDVYRALRALNPSPYMYFLDLDGTQVVGSSPEILVRRAGRHGHRASDRRHAAARRHPRGRPRARSRAARRPEGARRAPDADRPGPQRRRPRRRSRQRGGARPLPGRALLARHAHRVGGAGPAARGRDSFADVLKATFPAGTVSGAPKIRALEVIRELEPVKRNIYSGAVGYVGWWGDIDTAIAIRTAVIQDGRLHVQAGAGIVDDSDPEREWDETMNKGRALFRAVAQAASGL